MLVIRRRAGESLLIDGNIEVAVIEVSGTRVKLGIQAPASVTILRKEILLAAQQNIAAACAAGPAMVNRVLEVLEQRAQTALPADR